MEHIKLGVLDEINKSTCQVIVKERGRGTGWICSSDGLIMTAGHIITGNRQETLKEDNHISVTVVINGQEYNARVLYCIYEDADRLADFAVLEADDYSASQHFIPVSFHGDIMSLSNGYRVSVYGFGERHPGICYPDQGEIVGTITQSGTPFLIIDCPRASQRGWSGAAIFSCETMGAIGIQIRKSDFEDNDILAFPMSSILALLEHEMPALAARIQEDQSRQCFLPGGPADSADDSKGTAPKSLFTEWIEGLPLPPATNTPLHFRNPNISYVEKKTETAFLNRFIDDAAPLLLSVVTGPAGAGKSKFLYEFARSLTGAGASRPESWRVAWVTQEQSINELRSFHELTYHENVFMVIDYAGKFADRLGECLVLLKGRPRPPKMRIVLLERDGMVRRDKGSGRVALSGNNPLWYDRLMGVDSSADIKDMLFSVSAESPFMEISPLNDEELGLMLDRYAGNQGKSLPSERIKDILSYCNNTIEKQGERIRGVRPLIALIVADAWLNDNQYRGMKLHELLGDFISRCRDYWERRLCRSNKEIREAAEKLFVYATATGGLSISDTLPAPFSEALEVLRKEFRRTELMQLFKGLNEKLELDGVLFPMEPDLFGEFFVLNYLENEYDRCRVILAFGEKEKYLSFLDRSISNYATEAVFEDLFENAMAELMPDKIIMEYPLGCAGLLVDLSCEQEADAAAEAVEKLREISEDRYEGNAEIALEYAKGLASLQQILSNL